MSSEEPAKQELQDFLQRMYMEEKLNAESANLEKDSIQKYQQKLMKINAKIFFRFLMEKGVSNGCLACGSGQLSVPESIEFLGENVPEDFELLSTEEKMKYVQITKATYLRYVSFDGVDSLIGLRRSYYQVHCLNCGNLTLYRTAAVLNWLESQRVKMEGSNEQET